MINLSRAAMALIPLAFCSSLFAQFDSGSDGSDGAFNPQSNVVIDLSLAATGPWNMPSPVPGQGVYDPDKWAVVFKYTTVNIPAGVGVTFLNHLSGAPVVWLASSNVSITGKVSAKGMDGATWPNLPAFAIPGPGGFEGGRAIRSSPTLPSCGLGPGGGGRYQNQSGLYSYGNESILPLIGGSGGLATTLNGGGAGGGAIWSRFELSVNKPLV